MMKKKNIQLFIIVILICGFASTQAQNAKPINVVTTAVPFLRISPDARSGGMANIGLAGSVDANAGSFNPGKLPFNISRGGLSANYIPWMRDLINDMYLASLAGYYKLDENQAINCSLRYFSLGNIQFTDNMGNHLNSFRPNEFGIDMGYSRKLSEKSGIGVGLKYIHSQLADKGSGNNDYKAGNAVAANIGYYYNNVNSAGDGWSFGGALTNLGSKISYSSNANEKDFIPANLGLGTAYTKNFNDQNKITIGLDINKLLVPTPPAIGDSAALASYRSKTVLGSWFSSFGDAPGGFNEELREFQLSVGAEYWYNNQFAFRAGYFFEDKTKGDRKFFTMGAGIKYYFFTLNFSYLFQSGSGIDRNPLSNTLCFGLQFDFKN